MTWDNSLMMSANTLRMSFYGLVNLEWDTTLSHCNLSFPFCFLFPHLVNWLTWISKSTAEKQFLCQNAAPYICVIWICVSTSGTLVLGGLLQLHEGNRSDNAPDHQWPHLSLCCTHLRAVEQSTCGGMYLHSLFYVCPVSVLIYMPRLIVCPVWVLSH